MRESYPDGRHAMLSMSGSWAAHCIEALSFDKSVPRPRQHHGRVPGRREACHVQLQHQPARDHVRGPVQQSEVQLDRR